MRGGSPQRRERQNRGRRSHARPRPRVHSPHACGRSPDSVPRATRRKSQDARGSERGADAGEGWEGRGPGRVRGAERPTAAGPEAGGGFPRAQQGQQGLLCSPRPECAEQGKLGLQGLPRPLVHRPPSNNSKFDATGVTSPKAEPRRQTPSRPLQRQRTTRLQRAGRREIIRKWRI